jgi:hypothetical protein
MTKTICDRCGNEVTGAFFQARIHGAAVPRPYLIMLRLQFEQHTPDFEGPDLCLACLSWAATILAESVFSVNRPGKEPDKIPES